VITYTFEQYLFTCHIIATIWTMAKITRFTPIQQIEL